MDEKIKDQEVLLVKDQKGETLRAVAGADEKGELKTVPPTAEHEQSFLKFDKHSNALENFLSNFMRQFKNPTSLHFFKAPFESAVASARVLSEMLKAPDVPSNKEMLDSARVNPSDYAGEQKQTFQEIDPEKIDWEQFSKMGVSRESLENSKELEAMLKYRKSPHLVPISVKIGDVSLHTDARLSLRETEDGRFIPVVHAIRKEPQLEREFFGHTFTDEDKKVLRETGNLGRTVELTFPGKDEPTRSFVSIDRLTNDIIALSADRVRIPDEIKGVKLTDEQKKELSEGKSIYVEGMTSKTGKHFNANLQFNADKRSIEFRFGSPKQEQRQRQAPEGQEQTEQKELRVPKKMLGRDISPEEQAKLKAGETVYMTGLIDKKGEPFNAYVRPNFEKNKFDFLKWNPDKSQAKEVTPDNASRTQVAVNSEGKTNEATKHVKEPLKQEQTEPTAGQEQKEEEKKRSKGMKM
ncbi:DUF4099 domain-containing protein [Bacteroides thetaiotaomicron]|uniref:DUF4099 domain-containing protein n=1 Tax=Bacteroides thetaiotaomicron TaxID=818 RepID=UPI003563C428